MKLAGVSRVAKQTLKRFIYGTTAAVVGLSGMAVSVSLFLSPPAYAASYGDISINEISPASATEWVELYNPSNTTVSANNWVLYFDASPTTSQKITLTGNIPGHGYLEVDTVGTWLANAGDTVILKDDVSTVINQVAYGTDTGSVSASTPNPSQSLARTTNGGSTWAVGTPSKDASNNTADSLSVCVTGCDSATINSAIAAAQAGATIYVNPGTYTENVVVNKAITLSGAGAASANIVATDANSSPLTFSATGATVSGFTITHSYTPGELSAWNFNNNGVTFGQLANGNTLKDSTVTLNRNGVYLNNSENNVITGNTITNNRTGINMVNDLAGTRITSNIISNNWTLGLVTYGSSIPVNYSSITVSGNTFSGNWYEEVTVKDASANSGALDVTNNTFADSPVIYSTSSDSSLNEPGFAAQQPVSLGGTAIAPAGALPTLRIYNSGSVVLKYDHPKTINVLAGQSIQDAVNLANPGDTIHLNSDVTVTSAVNINKAITINGQGHRLNATFAKTSSSNNAAVEVLHSGVTIQNLIEDGTGSTALHGINIYASTGVTLDAVTVSNNGHAGIVVNGSTVTVNNIATSGNTWGGINVDQGSGVTSPAILTVNGTSSHSEATAIWIDDITKPNVSVVDTNHQYSYRDTGNTRVYSLLPSNQTAPNNNGEAIVTSAQPTVVVSSNSTPVNITVTSGTANATIDYSALKTTNAQGAQAVVPQTTIQTQNATVQIQSGTTITAVGGSWDGTIMAPTVQSSTSISIPTTSGTTTKVGTVIEVGSSSVNLTFDKAVRLLVPGQAGQLVGFIRSGNFTQISTACSADSQNAGNALPAGGDCYISVGSDMVIWTKHFTQFVTYATSATSNTTVSSANTNNTYTVRSGDTMYSIANKFSLSLEQLEALNPTAGHPAGNFGFILPGDILKVGSAKEITTASAVSGGNSSEVLGTQSNTPATGGQTSSTSTVNPKVAATNNAATAKKASGLAWYWWVVIVAVALAISAAYYIYRFAESVDKKS